MVNQNGILQRFPISHKFNPTFIIPAMTTTEQHLVLSLSSSPQHILSCWWPHTDKSLSLLLQLTSYRDRGWYNQYQLIIIQQYPNKLINQATNWFLSLDWIGNCNWILYLYFGRYLLDVVIIYLDVGYLKCFALM